MKKYVKPELEILELDSVNVIATSFSTSGSSKDDVVAGVHGSRGEWGNLWSSKD